MSRRRNNSLMYKVGKCIRRSTLLSNNTKIIPEEGPNKTSQIISDSQLNEFNINNTALSYPNKYYRFPNSMVVVVESLAAQKVPEISKKRWGYINVPSSTTANSDELDDIDEQEQDFITNDEKKKMKRWGFVAPIVSVPNNFPIFDPNPSPMKKRFYYYI